jgi:hypothetical protein
MIRKIKADDAPKMSRNKPARFENTPEWRDLKTTLDKRSLKPNEGRQIEFAEEDQKRYRITNRRTIARFIRTYLKDNNIPYQVNSFNEGDTFILQILYLPVLHRTA